MLRCLRALFTLMVLPAVAIIAAALARRREQKLPEEPVVWIDTKPEASGGVGTPKAPPVAQRAAPEEPDDLRRIEGIGPKISALLQTAGLTTFAQVAATEAASLRQILREGGIRMANPATWPEHAQLAAAGEWEALEALQDQLKGGRRT